jgi:hypothetical protein
MSTLPFKIGYGKARCEPAKKQIAGGDGAVTDKELDEWWNMTTRGAPGMILLSDARLIAWELNNLCEQKWIPVSERLPERGGVYICFEDADIHIAGYWPHFPGSKWGDIDNDKPYNPSHWMPLPEPPEES